MKSKYNLYICKHCQCLFVCFITRVFNPLLMIFWTSRKKKKHQTKVIPHFRPCNTQTSLYRRWIVVLKKSICIVLFLNEHTPLISSAYCTVDVFAYMQTTKQTYFLMMWLIAILILVLTPFNGFYDWPINRHATCRLIMALFVCK